MTTIEGSTENGSRVRFTVGKFDGMAGVRNRPGGYEVAYQGDAPPRLPADVTINGVKMQAASRINTAVNGFVVLWIPDAIQL